MNNHDNLQQQTKKKRALTKLAWLKLIIINLAILFLLAGIFDALGSYTPFKYAVPISIGIFILSAMVASNIKRAKPWSRFRWE